MDTNSLTSGVHFCRGPPKFVKPAGCPAVTIPGGVSGTSVSYSRNSTSPVGGKVVDKVYVMLKDLDGNYFEPMTIEVPNYFK